MATIERKLLATRIRIIGSLSFRLLFPSRRARDPQQRDAVRNNGIGGMRIGEGSEIGVFGDYEHVNPKAHTIQRTLAKKSYMALVAKHGQPWLVLLYAGSLWEHHTVGAAQL